MNVTPQKTFEIVRRYREVATFGVLGIIAGAALMLFSLSVISYFSTAVLPSYNFEVRSEVNTTALPAAAPVRLRVPSVGIDTNFEEPLGLNEDSSVEVPDSFDTVGWYKYGPTPGEVGPSVVLGHVDSKAGPGVFYELSDVEIGDEILVEREDGTTAEFSVTGFAFLSQDEFPTEQVYGDIDHSGLRLVTCTGVFVGGKERYSHNLIVYAELVS